jgi:hypothetical protein
MADSGTKVKNLAQGQAGKRVACLLAKINLVYRPLADRHLVDRHLVDRHFGNRHSADRHLVDKHLTFTVLTPLSTFAVIP